MAAPLISICILSFNRKDDLLKNLGRLRQDAYGNLEILVADNASADGTVAAVRQAFPEVQIFAHEKNIAIEALNTAVMAARGAYIFVLDDDSWPEEGTLSKVVAYMEAHPEVGLVACDILEPRTRKRWDMAYLPYELGAEPSPWFCFVGCGYMIRRALFQEMGGYPAHYFLYANESPVAAEVFLRGYDIHFLPAAQVFHKMPNRQSGFALTHAFYGLRNDLQAAWRYFHGWRYYNILYGRFFTGLILLGLKGKAGFNAYRRALREFYAYQEKVERRPLDKDKMRRLSAAFDGTTVTSFVGPRTLRRIRWYFGLYKDDRVVS